MTPEEYNIKINEIIERASKTWNTIDDIDFWLNEVKEGSIKNIYTEEQMLQAFEYGRTLEPFDCFEDFLNSLKNEKKMSLELRPPTIEEIFPLAAKQQLLNKIHHTEISDEEIKKQAIKYSYHIPYENPLSDFMQGAKWYREQLKNIK
jgi:hypothetical protein